MIIPPQLQDGSFRFIKVRENKAPLENDWTGNNNYTYDSPILQSFIEKNQRYGIIGGFGGLIVIDFDNPIFQNDIINKLPPTFAVRSAGRGLLHLYYLTDDPESFKILDLAKNTLADIQGRGKQVVGPNSKMPTGKTYEIVSDLPLTKINYSDLRIVFSKWFNIENEVLQREKKDTDFECKKIKEKIKVADVLGYFGSDTNKNPTDCPMHTSKGGKCLSYTQDVWYCFHCEQKGNIFHLMMSKNGCDFLAAKQFLAEKAGIKLKKMLNLGGLQIDDYTYNVEMFHQQHPFFFDKSGIFWFWNFKEYKYEIYDDIDVMNALDDLLGFEGKTVNSKLKVQYLESFKRVGRKHTPKNAPKTWIQFKDKAYSLETLATYDVTPQFFFTNPIPWNIGTGEETPIIDKLLTEWVGKEYVQDLYEIIAYCCYRDYPIQLLFCLYGSGRNGKGCYVRLLTRFIGSQNMSSTELDSLITSRFETFKLYKKLAVTMGETNFGILTKTSLLKKLVGGDLIGFEKKNKDPFDEYNYAKIIISTNSLPSTDDTSDGFFRRWHIIKFPKEFPEGHDIITQIPDSEYSNLAFKVVKILPNLLKNGLFNHQGDIQIRKNNYMEASNPLPLFINKYCDKDSKYFISYGELYTSYVYYLLKNKKRKVKGTEFRSALEDEGLWIEKTSKIVTIDDLGNKDYKSDRWIDGIKLKINWKNLINDNYDNYDNYDTFSTPIPPIGFKVKIAAQLSQLSQNDENRFLLTANYAQKCYFCGETPIQWVDTHQNHPLCGICKNHIEQEDTKRLALKPNHPLQQG